MWYVMNSHSGSTSRRQWGLPNDVPVTRDYDGDGTADFAVWRPSTGTWHVLHSSNGAQVVRQWGLPGDVPTPNDFDGDGRTDFAVWRPSTGDWYVVQSGNGQTVKTQWGLPGDRPVTTPQATSSTYQVYYRRPLLAAEPAGTGGAADAITERASADPQAADSERLAAIVDQAVATWMTAGLDPSRVELLQTVAVQFAQLDGRLLGTSDPFGVLLDADAAGHGWFVDATPSANEEFTPDPSGTLVATGDSSAAGRMDLLTVVMHELGHVLGIDDLHDEDDAEQIMAHELAPGVRKGLPTCADWDAIGSVFESWSAADLHTAEFAARPSRSAVTLPDRMDRVEAVSRARATRVGASRTDFFRVLGVEEEKDSDAFCLGCLRIDLEVLTDRLYLMV